jgi:hypothetical protein
VGLSLKFFSKYRQLEFSRVSNQIRTDIQSTNIQNRIEQHLTSPKLCVNVRVLKVPLSCTLLGCLIQVLQKNLSELQTTYTIATWNIFMLKVLLSIRIKCVPGLHVKGICVPSMTPTMLGKPIISQNFQMVLVNLYFLGAWMYLPNNSS